MEDKEGERQKRLVPIIALGAGSLMVLFGTIYMLKELAVLYGIGVGALVQASSSNSAFATQIVNTFGSSASSVASMVAEVTTLHAAIYESYILFLLALALTGSALIMFIRRYERTQASIVTYSLMHSMLMVVFLIVLYLVLTTISFQSSYMYVFYVGIVVCIISDIYMQYEIRQPSVSKGKVVRTLSMDPSKPFSNVITLQDQLFSSMSGHLKIVDKNFNSAALANFHRLSEKSIKRFTKITMLTSRFMMDTSFGRDINDFRAELTAEGIGLEVKLMDDKDSTEQHERLLLDDKIAYRIPPFNIINKRSEHITRINFGEANRRFDYLYGRAIKMENYAEKQAREGSEPKENKI